MAKYTGNYPEPSIMQMNRKMYQFPMFTSDPIFEAAVFSTRTKKQ